MHHSFPHHHKQLNLLLCHRLYQLYFFHLVEMVWFLTVNRLIITIRNLFVCINCLSWLIIFFMMDRSLCQSHSFFVQCCKIKGSCRVIFITFPTTILKKTRTLKKSYPTQWIINNNVILLLQLPTTWPFSTCVMIGRVVGNCSKGTLDADLNPVLVR